MLVQSCAFNVFFPPNSKIREHLFDLEKHFQDFQQPFSLIPLPPNAPFELPRIMATSQHGHSQMTISGNSAQIAAKYDGDYINNIQKCVGYISDKSKSIISALSILEETVDVPHFYYSGISINLLFDESDGVDNAVDYIAKKFIKSSTNLQMDEIQFRMALVVENAYYVNVVVQNNRSFLGQPDERGSFAELTELKNSIQVMLDINDRYAFNKTKSYYSSERTLERIAYLVDQFASRYMVEFIRTGEIHYDNQ